MKTMIVPCMVISARYCSGVMRPPSKNGSLAFGQARWMRISSERNIPTKTESTANKMYWMRSEEHTSELQSRLHLVCRLLLEKKKQNKILHRIKHISPSNQYTAELFTACR